MRTYHAEKCAENMTTRTSKNRDNEVSYGEKLTELELTLTILWNSIRRWLNQRSSFSKVNGLSDLDMFLLHLLVIRNKPTRGVDLAFALAVDDMHLVSYSLKKLTKLGLTSSAKNGKEVFYESTRAGKEHHLQFLEDRRKFLEPAIKYIFDSNADFESLNSSLQALSAAYEQAARAAASTKGK